MTVILNLRGTRKARGAARASAARNWTRNGYQRELKYLRYKGYGWRRMGDYREVFKVRPWSSREHRVQEAPVVPTAKVFFEEVRTACAPVAASLGLTGPDETDEIMPCSDYKNAVVEYSVRLNESEGTVGCSAKTETDTVMLTLNIEPLAMAIGVVEKRGGVSYSARNLKQLRKSLQGLVDYVQRVHPFFTDAAAAENLMRQAGAREWRKG